MSDVATTAEVTKEAIDKGLALLEQLAAKLGLTVDYLWPFMVREQVIQCLIEVLMVIISVIGVTIVARNVDFSVLSEKYKGEKKPLHHGILLMTGVICAITLITGFCGVWAELGGLINPQYHALKDLITMIR